ncbi:hypothetical protein EB06_00274 [Enterococcus cecorum]|uniref:IS21 family transposase n=1 Tax=Enterococcus cecorum TaxID=44008 RepID=UPI000E1AD242|nr:IS21 family transposase [Enterococcus cecorum]RBR34873.1 hypothetical protein EB06_00274 [Enterococcus cecorum]
MYEEKWGEIVSDWLFEDLKLRKKLRRTKKQIFEELKEMGFQGSYRTVCYFISEWMNTHQEEKDKGYERLEHPPGEAQVDFGVMEAVHDGEIVDIHALVMTFPHSNAGFAVPLPAENQECFLHGLNILFKQVGGVPKRIRIDNLTPAVKKKRTKNEEAQLTDEFVQFQNYYGFDVQVCNPRSGHEKGNVENKVGYIRYNFFTSAPIMDSYEGLTDQLFHKLEADRNRIHYAKNVRIEDLWQEERDYLLALPEKPYPVFKDHLVKVNKYNEVKVDQTLVHVPKGGNYSQLQMILTWDQLKIVSPNGEILLDDYRPYMKKRKALPWLSIIKTWIHKPRVVEYSRYNKYLPGRIKEFLLVDNLIIVSPHSNNAYKSTAPLVKIDISIKGGAFHMPEQKLTIVPVTLHSDTENISNIKPTVSSSNSTCTIKFGKVEISFFNGIDEHIIQTIMRELKDL